MGNDGKLKKSEKGSYPRPMGGPEPNAQGASDSFGQPGVPVNPGYDYSSSMPGVAKSELQKGFCNRESITDACKSDGMKEA